jgi:diaminohydroxyphosphoribosylaminopyrimidine deaminase / 5-amino-6-(5-phosphoribosylamino)uracil reductase
VTSPFMALALAEADRARGRTAPNPPVGAVLVRDGTIVGRGHTQPAGDAHAEIMALRQAGAAAQGATLYVTLEPCCHTGRTPPCTAALIHAGVTAVVAAVVDRNPRVANRGVAQLRDAGISVATGDGADESSELLQPFFKHITNGLPYVTAKWAMSLDGKIATRIGDARWVSGPAARRWTHQLRDVVDAIVVGVNTVLADDPALTVRLDDAGRRRAARIDRPWRVVLDSRCRLPLTARLLSPDLAAGTIVYHTAAAPPEACAAIAATGATVVGVPEDECGRVRPDAVLTDLGRRGCLHALVEGGGEIHASFLEAQLVDEVAAVIAPKLVGGVSAPGPLGGRGVERMADALTLADLRVDQMGADVLVRGVLAPPVEGNGPMPDVPPGRMQDAPTRPSHSASGGGNERKGSNV